TSATFSTMPSKRSEKDWIVRGPTRCLATRHVSLLMLAAPLRAFTATQAEYLATAARDDEAEQDEVLAAPLRAFTATQAEYLATAARDDEAEQDEVLAAPLRASGRLRRAAVPACCADWFARRRLAHVPGRPSTSLPR